MLEFARLSWASCRSFFATGGFRFFFYSNEDHPREPPHIHVRGERGEAKFWLYPDVRVAGSIGFNAGRLRELASVVEDNTANIERAWNEYFS